MKDERKTKSQLLGELAELRQRLVEAEAAASGRLQVQEALRINEERFRTALKDSPIVVFTQDRDLRYTWIYNPYPGFTADAVLGKTDAELLPPEDASRLAETKRQVMKTRRPAREEVRTTIGGEEFYYDLFVEPLLDPTGKVVGVTCVSTDVTERKRADRALQGALRAFRALSQCNQALIRAKEERTLLSEICRVIVEAAGYRMAWVGYADQDDAKSVRVVGHAGDEDGYLGQIRVSWADDERGRGPTGTAIRTGKPAICQDMLEDPRFAPWRSQAGKRGFASSIALPLVVDDEIIGALNMYAPEPNAFDAEEAKLLEEMAGDLGYGIGALRAREERAQAVAALRRERDLLERITQTSPVGIVLIDNEGLVTFANARAQEMLGLRSDQIAQRKHGPSRWRITDLKGNPLAEDDLPFRRVASGGQPVYRVRQAIERPDGSRVQLSINAAPLLGESGRVDGVVETLEDVTSLVRSGRALRESRRRLSLLMANLPGMAYRCRNDREWTMEFVSTGCLALTGYAPDDLVENSRTSYAALIHPDDRQAVWDEVQTAVQRREPFRITYRITTATGEERWVWEQGAGVFSAEQELLALEGFITDVTDRVVAEQQARRQERLAAVGRLASGIAHDFNNLLSTITLYAQMGLGEPHLSPKLAGYCQTILDESHQAASMVEQLLDFGGCSELERQPLDLSSVVEHVVGVLRPTLPESVLVTIGRGTGECRVSADPTRIQQVLTNLILNARDAMPEGGDVQIGLARLQVRTGQAPPVPGMPPGDGGCRSVSDGGHGIAPDVLPRIFEPFFTTRPRGQGTGLGLAQVHGIVEQHGGHVAVETEVGHGATFRVFLPALSSGGPGGLEGTPRMSPSPRSGTVALSP